MIRAEDRVSAVIDRDEKLIDVFASVSPSFERLKNPALRHSLARLVTVEQAARIAHVDPGTLVARLNEALGEKAAPAPAPAPAPVAKNIPPAAERLAIPAALASLPPDRLVDLDVRADLRAGREPFQRIMETVRSLRPDQVLRLSAIFEPTPLYAVLGRAGFDHFTERFADDDWRVWFHHAEASAATPSDDAVVILDLRSTPPEELNARALAALESLPRGKTLLQLHPRAPDSLLQQITKRGFTCEIREQSAELVRLFIRHQRNQGEKFHG